MLGINWKSLIPFWPHYVVYQMQKERKEKREKNGFVDVVGGRGINEHQEHQCININITMSQQWMACTTHPFIFDP